MSLAGCSDAPGRTSVTPGSDSSSKIAVLATTGMIADAARIVGGEQVEVTALMGPGVDPHLYQPTARDQGRLKGAQLIFYNGLHLEGRMVEVFESLAAKKRVVAVSKDLRDDQLLAWQTSAGMHDPHIWFDVKLWQQVVRTMATTYEEFDPPHSADFRRRAQAYLAELDDLDRYCRDRAGELPARQRVLITSHDAFHYFGRAYGFDVVGIQGISTESESGLRALTDAVDLIRARHIKAIFPETSVPRAAIERVAKDSGAVLGAELYSDALGAADGPAGTYAGMIRTNIDHIADALQGADSLRGQ
ncbi:MAG: manganese transporter [Planctomycetaceae bacterium]|nr:manganese transporter [Planctomycetaceae bacterium]